MKAIFVGGRLHAQLLEIPKGDSVYTTAVKIHGKVVELTYEARRHPQLMELTQYDGYPVIDLSVDFFMNERIGMWINNISKYTHLKPADVTTTKPPANSSSGLQTPT